MPLPARPALFAFYRLRADAQRLQQQLAAPDTLAQLRESAPPPTRTPAQAGYPIPFLSLAQQQQRAQQQRAHARAQCQQQARRVTGRPRLLTSPPFCAGS